MHVFPSGVLFRASTLAAAALAVPAQATVIHDESVDGDLSGAFTAPDTITVTSGINTIIGQVGNNGNGGATDGSDGDYFEFTLNPGQSISSFTVDSYVSSGSFGTGSFLAYSDEGIAVQSSDFIDGFVLFNSSSGNVLSGLSPDTGGVLNPGTHTFWVQETAAVTIDYQFSFNVVPEPSSLALIGLGAIAATRRRRR